MHWLGFVWIYNRWEVTVFLYVTLQIRDWWVVVLEAQLALWNVVAAGDHCSFFNNSILLSLIPQSRNHVGRLWSFVHFGTIGLLACADWCDNLLVAIPDLLAWPYSSARIWVVSAATWQAWVHRWPHFIFCSRLNSVRCIIIIHVWLELIRVGPSITRFLLKSKFLLIFSCNQSYSGMLPNKLLLSLFNRCLRVFFALILWVTICKLSLVALLFLCKSEILYVRLKLLQQDQAQCHHRLRINILNILCFFTKNWTMVKLTSNRCLNIHHSVYSKYLGRFVRSFLWTQLATRRLSCIDFWFPIIWWAAVHTLLLDVWGAPLFVSTCVHIV